MSVKIGFSQYKVMCIIGTLPHEQLKPQEIFITLKVSLRLPPERDAIVDTLDYAAIAKSCEEIAQERPHQLLETLAREILDTLSARYDCASAWIRLEKPAALAEAQCAFVEWEQVFV